MLVQKGKEVIDMKYWVGTMNRVVATEDGELPIKKEYWEECRNEWKEVSKEVYDKAYEDAWNIACNSFWHC